MWVEHRCIGKGQLVAIGDRLGVRLTSVFGAPVASDVAAANGALGTNGASALSAANGATVATLGSTSAESLP